MRLLAVSDLHGQLEAAWEAIEAAEPDVLLCCGDWGDEWEVGLPDLERFSERLPVFTVYGNHDNLPAVREWTNRDGSPVLLSNGEVRSVNGVTLAGVNGIWAKSHRKPFYITDEEVDEAALQVAAQGGKIDVFLSHGCPSGVADRTWNGRHAGQGCFLRAFQTIRPRVYLTGHIHNSQEYRTQDGLVVRNVGLTPHGDATLLEVADEELRVTPFKFN